MSIFGSVTGFDKTRLLRVLLAGATIAGSACTAAAAAVTQENNAVDDSGTLEQIIVTAQKRQENLQDVPVAVQVISGVYLAEGNHNGLAELSETTPELHISRGLQSDTLYIRGIGSGGDQPAFDQSIGTFIDDISYSRSHLSGASFLDLERIEVLKGPLSTTFGANAIAGALNVVTKKPGDQLEAWGRALYGQFGQYAFEGAIGGPVTDTVRVRFAATRNGTAGWIDNVDINEKVPIVNNLAGRMTLVFKPSENFDATFKLEGSRHNISGTFADAPIQWTNCPPQPPLPPTFSGNCAQALALKLPIGLDQNNTSGLPGQGSYLSTADDVLTMNYRFLGNTLTSVTGYYHYNFTANYDFGNLPTNTYATGASPENGYQFSQEFRITSPAGQPWEYLAGLYFQTDKWASAAQVGFPLFDGFFPPPSPLNPYLPLGGGSTSSQGEHLYGVFGSLSWNVTDQLKLTGGLRGSYDYKSSIDFAYLGTASSYYGALTPLPPDLVPMAEAVFGPTGYGPPISESSHAWMPSGGVQYKITPQAMLYFTYTRGFKPGGINPPSPFGSPVNATFGPEHVNAFEVGIKSTWLNDTVLVNLDVFRMNYQGLQVTDYIFVPAKNFYIPEIASAATSRSQGVEFTGQWVVTKDFRLGATIAYLDSHYVSFTNATPQVLQTYCSTLTAAAFHATPQCGVFGYPVPPFANISGQRTMYAPLWSGNVTASYTLPLGQYKFVTDVGPYFTTRYNEQDPYVTGTPGYMRLDARLSLVIPGGHWTMDVIGKNLTDRNIPTTFAQGAIGGQIYLSSKEQPRNVAFQVRYQY